MQYEIVVTEVPGLPADVTGVQSIVVTIEYAAGSAGVSSGSGLPAGGVATNILVKNSSTDGDASWQPITLGSGDLPALDSTMITDFNEAVDDRMAVLTQNGVGITWAYNDGAGTFTPTVTLSPFSTTNLAEGSNQYFLESRARAAISATSPITYNSSTGVVAFGTQTANRLLAGPASGSAAAPTFRAFVYADLPTGALNGQAIIYEGGVWNAAYYSHTDLTDLSADDHEQYVIVGPGVTDRNLVQPTADGVAGLVIRERVGGNTSLSALIDVQLPDETSIFSVKSDAAGAGDREVNADAAFYANQSAYVRGVLYVSNPNSGFTTTFGIVPQLPAGANHTLLIRPPLDAPAAAGYAWVSTDNNSTQIMAWAQVQPYDADLAAIASLSTNGFAERTGTATWVITGFTGTGSVVRATSPTLVTPVLGTPTSGTLTNCTGLPVAGITGTLPVNKGGTGVATFTTGVVFGDGTTALSTIPSTFDGSTLDLGLDAVNVFARSLDASHGLYSGGIAVSTEGHGHSVDDVTNTVQAGMLKFTLCRVATTANITLSSTQTIDGVACVAGDYVLVKNQTTASQNGVYVVAAGAWSRAVEADTAVDLNQRLIFVTAGTVSVNTFWQSLTQNPTVGTTSQYFGQALGPKLGLGGLPASSNDTQFLITMPATPGSSYRAISILDSSGNVYFDFIASGANTGFFQRQGTRFQIGGNTFGGGQGMALDAGSETCEFSGSCVVTSAQSYQAARHMFHAKMYSSHTGRAFKAEVGGVEWGGFDSRAGLYFKGGTSQKLFQVTLTGGTSGAVTNALLTPTSKCFLSRAGGGTNLGFLDYALAGTAPTRTVTVTSSNASEASTVDVLIVESI